MTNELVFGSNHNGIECISNPNADRPCDKVWFTVKQIEEWSGMTNRTLYNRLKELEECERIQSLQDFAKIKIPDNNGRDHETTIYNLNVLNQLAMVEMRNRVLNETAKKFSDILSEIETTGSYSVKQKDSYMIEDPIERAKAWIAEQEAHKAQLALANSKLALKDEQINTLEIDNHNKDILIDGNYRTIKLIADEIEALGIVHYARGTLEGKVRSACKREAKVLGKPLQERITVVDDQERKTYLVPNEVYRLVMDRVKNDNVYLKRMK